jgi:hypothetical protein
MKAAFAVYDLKSHIPRRRIGLNVELSEKDRKAIERIEKEMREHPDSQEETAEEGWSFFQLMPYCMFLGLSALLFYMGHTIKRVHVFYEIQDYGWSLFFFVLFLFIIYRDIQSHRQRKKKE